MSTIASSVWSAEVQWVAVSPRDVGYRLDTLNSWRLVDDTDMYWLDELAPAAAPTPRAAAAGDVLQVEPSDAVKSYLRDEERRCIDKLHASNATGRRLPPCPCVSPDLRTS